MLSRVVALNHIKVAGELKPPPAMVRDVVNWVLSSYAGSILAYTSKESDKLDNASSGVNAKIKELEKTEENLEGILENLTDGQTWTIATYDDYRVGVKAEFMYEYNVMWYRVGTGRGHTVYRDFLDLEAAIMWLGDKIGHAVIKLKDFRGTKGTEDGLLEIDLIELKLIAAECKKYTSEAKHIKSRVTKTFPMNLDGWGYLDGWLAKRRVGYERSIASNRAVLEKVKEEAGGLGFDRKTSRHPLDGGNNYLGQFIPGVYQWDCWIRREPEHTGGDYTFYVARAGTELGSYDYWRLKSLNTLTDPKNFISAAQLAISEKGISYAVYNVTASVGPRIKAIFDIRGKKSYSGMWRRAKRPPELEVNTPVQWPHTVEVFRQVMNEIRNTAIHELQHMTQDLIGGMTNSFSSGMPASVDRSGIRNPEHALRDVEFYTRLTGEINRFVELAERRIPQYDISRAIKVWTNELPNVFIRHVEPKEFFVKLKQHKPDRWRKAVTEFYKGVTERLGL